MSVSLIPVLALATAGALPSPARFAPDTTRLVDVSVQVDGRDVALYPDPWGRPRAYVEARRGAAYTVRVRSLTHERLGVRVSVDGLDAISGRPANGTGSMYVIEPGRRLDVRGWRTSLAEVQRFTFVDEQRSYAARTGRSLDRAGWIEVDVYRERHPPERVTLGRAPRPLVEDAAPPTREAASPPASTRPDAAEPEARAKSAASDRATAHPGTGWGERTRDRAVRVAFDPEPRACEHHAVRYEYRPGLVALGVLPTPGLVGRLAERDAGGMFALPPPE